VDAAAVVRVAAVEEEAVAGEAPRADRPRSQRRRISSTCPSTWTRKSVSSSMEDEKVKLNMGAGYKISANHFWHPVTGKLKGFDQLMNLVLDDVQELLRGQHLSFILTGKIAEVFYRR